MTTDQIAILALFGALFVGFLSGRWRYDMVAFAALLAALLLGLVPVEAAFSGFGHPAVITVAAVLIVSRGLSVSGAIDRIAHHIVPATQNMFRQIGTMAGISALMSAFMNNVGALALLMPAAIESAKRTKRSPSLLLMPLSFASILGGLITLIGTPPNIIIATYRGDAMGAPFAMFDFAPVGLAVTAVGILYLALVGWRLVPKARQGQAAGEALLDISGYIAELRVGKDNKWVGRSLAELGDVIAEKDGQIAGLLRGSQDALLTAGRHRLRAGDVILIEAEPTAFETLAEATTLKLVAKVPEGHKTLSSDSIALMEAVITADSRLLGRIIGDMRLRSRYGVNLLGISRQGQPVRQRLHKERLKAGDILLFQADIDGAADTLSRLGLLPLAARDLAYGKRDKAGLATVILVGAIALATFGAIKLTFALVLAGFLMVATQIVPLRDVYDSIEWPVIVLIAALIPIGGALESTGTTQLIAGGILAASGGAAPWVALTLLFVVTMTLSDVMNNAATAVVMAPVGVAMAQTLGVNPDSFLMAVAVSASCAFLTPIGHKNNALIMGPGGYHFGDYWRMGLPLEVLVVLVGVPVILIAFPL